MKCSKKTKRLFSVLLVVAMCFTLLPSMTALADPTETNYTITFTSNADFPDWENVYVYYSPGNCMWPGVEMTKSDDQYKATVNSDALTVSGGSVTAVGNNGALFTAPTLVSDVTAVASANTDGTDHVSYDASQNDSYKWFRATETNTDLTIGGKSEWEFGDTIEFGSEEFYYIYNDDRSVHHTNGDATLRYERWSSIYKQHLIYLYILPTQYYIYIQPEDHEAETPQTPAGLKLIGGNGTEENPYEFALWYKYTVNLTAGANMTKTSGEGSQTVKEGEAITDVVYTANDGYCFPDTYSVEAVNGITVTRNSATQITVSGTPTGNVDITLTAPSAHSPAAAVKENEHSASCEESGSFDEVIYCAVCGEEISRTPRTIDPLGHNWGTPSYSWADDNKKVTASRVCGRDASHVDSETVNTTSEETKPATYTTKGETTYTATFTKTAFTTQTKTVADIPMLVQYTVNITAGANMTKTSGEESQTVKEGEAVTDVVYTASGGYCFPDTYSVEAVNGITVTRNSATQITVSGTPTGNADITLTAPSAHSPAAAVKENEHSASCEGSGSFDEVIYCAVCGEEISRTPRTINPLGHNWGTPSYSWADDNKEVTASRVCGRDASHVDSETVNTTSEETKPATYTTKGETTYTATFTKTGFTQQTKTVEDIPMLVQYTVNITAGANMTKTSGEESQTVKEGEAVTDVVYTASGGYCFPDTYSVEAVNGITVTRNSATQITVSGTPTGNVDITLTAPSAHSPAAAVKENEHSASCEGSGSFDEVIYCAVCGEEISRTPRTIDPLGHNWGTPSYSWADDNKEVTASRVCGRDASHIDSETVNTASEITKQATVTAKGETTYTATFTKTVFTTQTKTVADIPMLVPTFTITFNANGGTVTPAKDETDTDGKLTSLPTPTRTGYRFNGWFTAASGGTKITTETVFEAETEVFAQWTKNSSSRGGGGGSTPVTYTVTPAETDNGSVNVNPKDATKGSTVTITVTPDEGYKLDKLTVTDKDGKDVEVTEKDGEYTFTMPAGKVDVTPVFVKEDIEPTTPPADPTPMPTDDENPFTDIAKGDYFYDAVLWAAKKDITQGTSDTKFSPNDSCTRAQTVTFLWRTEGSPEPNTAESPFADIKADDYFYKAVLWAYENGITNGTSDTSFSPHDTVTRGQTVTFLYRMKGEKASVENPFEDIFEGDYYYDPVLWAYENEITSGTTDTTFSPADNCLRGQIVTFLYRCYK